MNEDRSEEDTNSVGEHQQSPIENVPEKVKDKIQSFMGVQLSTQHRSQALIEKMEPEHIATALGNADKSDARQHNTGRFQIASAIIGLFLMCWLFFAYGAEDHIDALIGGLLGFVGGFGIGLAKNK